MKMPEPKGVPCWLCGEIGWHTLRYDAGDKYGVPAFICWDCYKDRQRDGEMP